MKAALLLAFALSGCANTIPADPTHMSPEQLRELAKDRSAMAACTVVNSPWGVGRTIFVQLDQKTIPAGSVTVGTDCSITVQSEAAQKAEAKKAKPMNCYPGNADGSVVVCEPVK